MIYIYIFFFAYIYIYSIYIYISIHLHSVNGALVFRRLVVESTDDQGVKLIPGGSEVAMVTSRRWWILNCRTIQHDLVNFLNCLNFLKFLVCPLQTTIFRFTRDFGMDLWFVGIYRLGIPEWNWPRVWSDGCASIAKKRRSPPAIGCHAMPPPLQILWEQHEKCQVEWQEQMAKYHSDKAKYQWREWWVEMRKNDWK